MAEKINKVKGYRTMAGITQEEMAACLGISAVAYRQKENNIRDFTRKEMILFVEKIKKYDNTVTLDAIFLD